MPLCSCPFLFSHLHTSSFLSNPLHSGPFLPNPLHSFPRRTTRATDFGLIDGPRDGPNARPRTHMGRPQRRPHRPPAGTTSPLAPRRCLRRREDADRLLGGQSNRQPCGRACSVRDSVALGFAHRQDPTSTWSTHCCVFNYMGMHRFQRSFGTVLRSCLFGESR